MEKEQRLILINQFEILKQLNSYDADYYSEKIEILKEGYEYHYDDVFSEVSNPLSEESSKFVIDILNMYRDITFSKNKLSSEDSKILADEITYFKGFDFNDSLEVRLGGYAQFFIEKLDRFKELVEDKDFDGFNSHWEMVKSYEDYLNNYNHIKHCSDYKFGELSAKQIKEILK